MQAIARLDLGQSKLFTRLKFYLNNNKIRHVKYVNFKYYCCITNDEKVNKNTGDIILPF